jgi:hypothetical protein
MVPRGRPLDREAAHTSQSDALEARAQASKKVHTHATHCHAPVHTKERGVAATAAASARAAYRLPGDAASGRGDGDPKRTVGDAGDPLGPPTVGAAASVRDAPDAPVPL